MRFARSCSKGKEEDHARRLRSLAENYHQAKWNEELITDLSVPENVVSGNSGKCVCYHE